MSVGAGGWRRVEWKVDGGGVEMTEVQREVGRYV